VAGVLSVATDPFTAGRVAQSVFWCNVIDVRYGYFESFAQMIEGLPAKAIFRAAEMERRMLEDDMSSKRLSLTSEEYSVLDFCHFLEAIRLGTDIVPSASRAWHASFYRKIVEKLVEAKELPPDARERFDTAFSSGFLKALTT
jgi:hypothetical protein